MIYALIGHLLIAGPCAAWLGIWFTAPKAHREPEQWTCRFCGEPFDGAHHCPNAAMSGVERYDSMRIYCGHAELRGVRP